MHILTWSTWPNTPWGRTCTATTSTSGMTSTRPWRTPPTVLFPSARAGLHPLLRVAQFTSSPSAQAGASLSPRAEQPILLTMEVNREMAKTSHVKEEGDRIIRFVLAVCGVTTLPQFLMILTLEMLSMERGELTTQACTLRSGPPTTPP